MRVTIKPGKAAGTISVPPSKSMAHRLLICAGLSQGITHIRNIALSEDILATIDCLRALGISCEINEDTVTVMGIDPQNAVPTQTLNCRESGSTLRFLIPTALLCGQAVTFTGSEKLLTRPLDIYETLCADMGYLFENSGKELTVKGRLTGGTYHIPGNISSQFITGLLLALPLAEKDSRIHITTALESKSYIALTLQAMAAFGVHAYWQDSDTLMIPGSQRYTGRNMTVEGDYSSAAFFAALSALGGNIAITGLTADSLQGDKVFHQHLESLCDGHPTIDISDCPDLGPILFAVAAAKNGAVFTGTRRLQWKESDRVAAMTQELAAFGTTVKVEENTVTVLPSGFHQPTSVLNGHNDHRIVMALAVLLTLTGGTIEGAEAVSKSFPDYFKKLQSLGIQTDIII